MLEDNNGSSFLSGPWEIEFFDDDNQASQNVLDNVTAQTANLQINEEGASVEPKSSCSWSDHEKLTGEILNQAAHRAAAETFKNICIYHPTQNHRPSKDSADIRPDYVLAWSYNGVRKNTAVVDAKDYHGDVPRSEYDKICRDMRATKATRGILVLGENATISDKLLADIEKDNRVDIVRMANGQANVVRDLTQHIGKIIDKDFVPDDKRWDTYQSHVTPTQYSQQRRPNPHGERDTYTCNSTYYRFNYPRKQDGTIDERFAANSDRNKDGGPDMRMPQNKTTQAQEQLLNQDGSEDMRSKEHREQLVDESGHRLNIDGSTDKRCNENKTETPVSEPSNQTDMRQKENRENMVDSEGHHLNVDGSLDIGCKENQEETNTPPSDEPQLDTNQTTQDGTDETNMAIPTKNYGTADMWYTASREAVASGAIEPDEQLIEENTTMPTGSDEGVSGQSALTDIPTKSDGTADMRFSASQDAVASGEISRDEVLAGGTMDSIGDALESSSNMIDSADSAAGPLKADGTPDMRFSANQE